MSFPPPLWPQSASGGPATQIQESSGPTTLTIGAIADGEFAKRVGSTLVGAAAGGAGAPVGASYVVVGLDGTLTAERKLVAGAGISLADGGAGGDLSVAATVRGTTGGHVSGGGGLARWYEAGRVNGTASTAASFSANVLRAVPFRAPARGCTIDQLAFLVTTLLAGNARIGAYRATSESNLYPGSLICDSGDISTGSATVKTFAPTPFVLTPGELIWLVHVGSVAPSLRSIPVGALDAILGTDTAMGTAPGIGLSVAHAYAALPASFPAGAAALTAAVPSLAARLSA